MRICLDWCMVTERKLSEFKWCVFGTVESNLGVNLLKRHCSLSRLFMQIGYKMQFPTESSKSYKAYFISLSFFYIKHFYSLPFIAGLSKKYFE